MESPAAAPGFVPAFVDAGEGMTFKMLGTTMRLIATAAETAGRYAVLEQGTPVGWGPPRHIHSREDEIFYILEGTYEVHCGDERRTVSAGACAILPRGVPHGFRNSGLAPARLIFVITPGGLEDSVAGIRSWCKEFAQRHKMEIDFRNDTSSLVP